VGLCDEVREHCARVAARSQSVRIDLDALEGLEAPRMSEASRGGWGGPPSPALDPQHHYLEGTPADVATCLLTLDAIKLRLGLVPNAAQGAGLLGLLHDRLGPGRSLPRRGPVDQRAASY